MKLAVWPIEKIKPYDLNAKKHDSAQIKKIAQSIAEFGWDQPIVVDKNGVIIKGHGRRLAAMNLGYKEVPVLVRDDLTPDQVRAARLADNRVAVGDVDPEILRKELETLEFDLEGIFDAKELQFLSADLFVPNIEAITTDLDAELKKSDEEAIATVAAADKKIVPIAEALGFKSVPGEAQRALARFMAKIEAEFNLPPDKAFLKFVNDLLEQA
jgi:ParB-like chromosome segregation protein Spo0J